MHSDNSLPQKSSAEAGFKQEQDSSATRHLIALPLKSSSNKLHAAFRNELLHLMGLTDRMHENKGGDSNKKLSRLPPAERNRGSLLELTLEQLYKPGLFSSLTASEQLDKTKGAHLHDIALQLCISWMERLLFLKLLEGRLLHEQLSQEVSGMLKPEKVTDFSALHGVFLQLSSCSFTERSSSINRLFKYLPCQQLSLFNPTALERRSINISALPHHSLLPLLTDSIIEDEKGAQAGGGLTTLSYLLHFLNAFDLRLSMREHDPGRQKNSFDADETALTSPVCYINSPEIRDDYLIPEQQDGYTINELRQPLDSLLTCCFGAHTMESCSLYR
ncbi:hypothetical protein [Cesiribacter sp. SM1]|uniref:type IIG restriction enzyme/methyltransferase n=1 Tax=Cesiribacter sp. SM1 TaxID=2861196 RepID=UPI001CD36557|nr:hypothetical protein [Cesiribacter sp. SM1]